MKTTPTITEEQLTEFGSKLNQFIGSDDWKDMLPDIVEFVQDLVDSRSIDDAEATMCKLDRMLTYDPDKFVFGFTASFVGNSEDKKYSLDLQIGQSRRPYTLTFLSRP